MCMRVCVCSINTHSRTPRAWRWLYGWWACALVAYSSHTHIHTHARTHTQRYDLRAGWWCAHATQHFQFSIHIQSYLGHRRVRTAFSVSRVRSPVTTRVVCAHVSSNTSRRKCRSNRCSLLYNYTNSVDYTTPPPSLTTQPSSHIYDVLDKKCAH